MTLRILVTSSRTWPSRSAVVDALDYLHNWAFRNRCLPLVVVHGDALGGDRYAKQWVVACNDSDIQHEDHPVTNEQYRTGGKGAPMHRNTFMVDRGADICLSFQNGSTPGTADCTAKAHLAEIPVWAFYCAPGSTNVQVAPPPAQFRYPPAD